MHSPACPRHSPSSQPPHLPRGRAAPEGGERLPARRRGSRAPGSGPQEAAWQELGAERARLQGQLQREREELLARLEAEKEELSEEVAALQQERDEGLLLAETEKQQVRGLRPPPPGGCTHSPPRPAARSPFPGLGFLTAQRELKGRS